MCQKYGRTEQEKKNPGNKLCKLLSIGISYWRRGIGTPKNWNNFGVPAFPVVPAFWSFWLSDISASRSFQLSSPSSFLVILAILQYDIEF
jgi:hypothetical protein